MGLTRDGSGHDARSIVARVPCPQPFFLPFPMCGLGAKIHK